MGLDATHCELAAQLRRRVLESGMIARDLRDGAMALGGGAGGPLPAPYGQLAQKIGQASYRVTDGDVAEVREAAGSDKAAFEVVMAASIGAGLQRWDAALRAIQGASDAAS